MAKKAIKVETPGEVLVEEGQDVTEAKALINTLEETNTTLETSQTVLTELSQDEKYGDEIRNAALEKLLEIDVNIENVKTLIVGSKQVLTALQAKAAVAPKRNTDMSNVRVNETKTRTRTLVGKGIELTDAGYVVGGKS